MNLEQIERQLRAWATELKGHVADRYFLVERCVHGDGLSPCVRLSFAIGLGRVDVYAVAETEVSPAKLNAHFTVRGAWIVVTPLVDGVFDTDTWNRLLVAIVAHEIKGRPAQERAVGHVRVDARRSELVAPQRSDD